MPRSAAPPAAPVAGPPPVLPEWIPPPDERPADATFATTIVPGRPAVRLGCAGTALVPRRRPLSLDDYTAGVLARDPAVLGRALSLVESNAPADAVRAADLLARLLPHTGRARRLGLTGIPGAGKSTFIEALGGRLVAAGHRVAVLAVDPSSSVTGGSLLADKVRMEKLARHPAAFIRPSPSGGSLGGVARKTREAILVCEAAGFDIVLVETVGVGQSEVAVRAMVDCFLVLLIPGAGDELQGLKKGVIELADALVINKADGDNRPRALAAQAEMTRVLHYLGRTVPGWSPPALLASALTGDGLPEVWSATERFFDHTTRNGSLAERRRRQAVAWLHALVEEGLRTRFHDSPVVRNRLPALEAEVAAGRLPATAAARELLGLAL